MAHRQDYQNVVETLTKAGKVLEELGISNIKLNEYHITKFCEGCGANLLNFYGPEGGDLLDEAYVQTLTNS